MLSSELLTKASELFNFFSELSLKNFQEFDTKQVSECQLKVNTLVKLCKDYADMARKLAQASIDSENIDFNQESKMAAVHAILGKAIGFVSAFHEDVKQLGDSKFDRFLSLVESRLKLIDLYPATVSDMIDRLNIQGSKVQHTVESMAKTLAFQLEYKKRNAMLFGCGDESFQENKPAELLDKQDSGCHC